MTNKLAVARKRKGYTQEFVGMQVGCKQANISHLESGRQVATRAMALKLAALLEMDVVDVLYPGHDDKGK